MVDSISNAAFLQRPPPVPNGPDQRADQNAARQEVVSNETADALTEAPPSEIVQQSAETTLTPDPVLRQDTGAPAQPPAEQGPQGEINSEAVELLTNLIEGYNGADMTSEDWENVYARLEESGFDLSSPFVDIRV